MVWRSHTNSETTGADGKVASADWDHASKLNTAWDSITLATDTITLPGDGKYTVVYSGAQNLDQIDGTSNGDVIFLKADVTSAGGSLTIRHNSGGGNLRTNAAVDIVLADDTEWAIFTHIGSVLSGGKFYGLP